MDLWYHVRIDLGTSIENCRSEEGTKPVVGGNFGTLERRGLEHIFFLESGSGEMLCGHCCFCSPRR